VNKLRCLPVR